MIILGNPGICRSLAGRAGVASAGLNLLRGHRPDRPALKKLGVDYLMADVFLAAGHVESH